MTEANDMEGLISRALRERLSYFKQQADSLTLEGVRRLLEKDLRLNKFDLDVHKRFVKKCLEECFASLGDENSVKSTGENGEVNRSKAEQTVELHDGDGGTKNGPIEDEEKPALPPEVDLDQETKETPSERLITEDIIKKAVKNRAPYFREHAESVTMVGVRRLLEEDLNLEKHTLDAHKTLIKMAVNEVIESSDVDEEKVREGEGSSESEASYKSSSEDAEIEEQTKPKRPKAAQRGKATKTEELKKRKRLEDQGGLSDGQKKKLVKTETENSDDSEKDGSQSSSEGHIKKKKEQSTQAYGKRVEHLKSVIKACGMTVPPSVYKRAKQAPESKRESSLIKELEEILRKEGLSSNPSEKEIKAVKKKKERAKELEGIDMSNIVSSSRRRSANNFIMPPPPPKPKTPDETVEDEEVDEEVEGEDSEEEEEASDEDNGDSEESSEGFNEDSADESD